jgi:general secretion pathway protein G
MTAVKKGFTLVEILVVVGLLGLLTTVGLTSYSASIKNSRDVKRKTDLETIRQALELYKSDNSFYVNVSSGTAQNLKTPLSSPIVYLNTNSFPNDPNSETGMIYYYNRLTASTYYLCAYLEKAPATNTCPATVNCDTTTSTKNCNYGITQP